MHGQFAGEMENNNTNNIWRLTRKSDLKGCTEALRYSAQGQSIRTNYIKCNIDKTAESPLCMMCGTRNEIISHIVSECGKLVPRKYKRRHDSAGRYVHWQFCEKLGFNRARLWCEHEPESLVENENVKILWDFTKQCDCIIKVREPDIVVVDTIKKEAMILDVAIPEIQEYVIKKEKRSRNTVC